MEEPKTGLYRYDRNGAKLTFINILKLSTIRRQISKILITTFNLSYRRNNHGDLQ